MVACDGNCSSLRPSEVGLVLLCTYLDAAVAHFDATADSTALPGPSSMEPTPAHQMRRLAEFAKEIREMCKVRIIFNFMSHNTHRGNYVTWTTSSFINKFSIFFFFFRFQMKVSFPLMTWSVRFWRNIMPRN